MKTLGASNHVSEDRAKHDYYATDPKAIELLLDEETFSHEIWEPACGEGHLSKALIDRGYDVLGRYKNMYCDDVCNLFLYRY